MRIMIGCVALALLSFGALAADTVVEEVTGQAVAADVSLDHDVALDGHAAAVVNGESCQAEPVPMLFPVPVPNYCPSCAPCTSHAQCGRDPHNGSNLGVCSAPPNSWCPGTTTSVCICY